MALGGTSSFAMFQNLNILVYLGWTDWAFNYTKYIPLINYFFYLLNWQCTQEANIIWLIRTS